MSSPLHNGHDLRREILSIKCCSLHLDQSEEHPICKFSGEGYISFLTATGSMHTSLASIPSGTHWARQNSRSRTFISNWHLQCNCTVQGRKRSQCLHSIGLS